MLPRFTYRIVVLDAVPASCRTKERNNILTLFNQFKARNPEALPQRSCHYGVNRFSPHRQ